MAVQGTGFKTAQSEVNTTEKKTRHKANVANGTNYAQNDVIEKSIVLNQATGAVINTIYQNLDKGTILGMVPPAVELDDFNSDRKLIDTVQQTFTATQLGITSVTIPAQANFAEISADNEFAYSLENGVVADQEINANTTLTLESRDEIIKAEFIRFGTLNAVATINFYKRYN